MSDQLDVMVENMHRITAERDAAIARAERAEATPSCPVVVAPARGMSSRKWKIGDLAYRRDGGDVGVVYALEDDRHIRVGWPDGVATTLHVGYAVHAPDPRDAAIARAEESGRALLAAEFAGVSLANTVDEWRARAEAAEALAASRLDVSPEDVGAFLHVQGFETPDELRAAYGRAYTALRAHAAKVSR